MQRLCATICLSFFIITLAARASLAAPKLETDDEVLYGPNGLTAYVNKKGANIRVHRVVNGTSDSNKEHGFGQTGVVEVFLDAIEELDADLGNPKGGSIKISSFAKTVFNIQAIYNVSLPLAIASNVTADCLNCSATLAGKVGNGAKISMAVCAINANGTLDLNGELTNVTEGQLKITFTIVDWPWAADTNKLAVDIVIKVPPGRTVYDNSTDSRGKPAKFSLGAGSFVEFSRLSFDDGRLWKDMPSGYPKYISRGANNQFRLILGHFSTSSIYDPNLEVGYQSNCQRPTQHLLTVVLLSALAMLKSFF